jgi:hypothetical protein
LFLLSAFFILAIIFACCDAFNGDVRVTSRAGTIFAEQLTFTSSNNKYSTDKPIRIITSDSEITGDGFEMNEMFTSYKIYNMKGVIKPPSEEIQ